MNDNDNDNAASGAPAPRGGNLEVAHRGFAFRRLASPRLRVLSAAAGGGADRHVYEVRVQPGRLAGAFSAAFLVDGGTRFRLTAPSAVRAEKCALAAAKAWLWETARRRPRARAFRAAAGAGEDKGGEP